MDYRKITVLSVFLITILGTATAETNLTVTSTTPTDGATIGINQIDPMITVENNGSTDSDYLEFDIQIKDNSGNSQTYSTSSYKITSGDSIQYDIYEAPVSLNQFDVSDDNLTITYTETKSTSIEKEITVTPERTIDVFSKSSVNVNSDNSNYTVDLEYIHSYSNLDNVEYNYTIYKDGSSIKEGNKSVGSVDGDDRRTDTVTFDNSGDGNYKVEMKVTGTKTDGTQVSSTATKNIIPTEPIHITSVNPSSGTTVNTTSFPVSFTVENNNDFETDYTGYKITVTDNSGNEAWLETSNNNIAAKDTLTYDPLDNPVSVSPLDETDSEWTVNIKKIEGPLFSDSKTFTVEPDYTPQPVDVNLTTQSGTQLGNEIYPINDEMFVETRTNVSEELDTKFTLKNSNGTVVWETTLLGYDESDGPPKPSFGENGEYTLTATIQEDTYQGQTSVTLQKYSMNPSVTLDSPNITDNEIKVIDGENITFEATGEVTSQASGKNARMRLELQSDAQSTIMIYDTASIDSNGVANFQYELSPEQYSFGTNFDDIYLANLQIEEAVSDKHSRRIGSATINEEDVTAPTVDTVFTSSQFTVEANEELENIQATIEGENYNISDFTKSGTTYTVSGLELHNLSETYTSSLNSVTDTANNTKTVDISKQFTLSNIMEIETEKKEASNFNQTTEEQRYNIWKNITSTSDKAYDVKVEAGNRSRVVEVPANSTKTEKFVFTSNYLQKDENTVENTVDVKFEDVKVLGEECDREITVEAEGEATLCSTGFNKITGQFGSSTSTAAGLILLIIGGTVFYFIKLR